MPPPPTVVRRPALILAAVAPVIALGLLNGLYLEPLHARAPLAFWTADALHFVVLPLLALYLLRRLGLSWAALGLAPPASARSALLLGGQTLLAWAAYTVVYLGTRQLAARLLDGTAPAFGYGTALPDYDLARLAGVLYFAASAALSEEFVYRGVLWAWARARLPARTARAVFSAGSALLFAAIHWENGAHELAATFALGLLAGALYLRIASLWPLIGAHFLVDLFEFG